MADRRNRQIVEISRHSGKTMNKIEFFIFGAMMVYIVVLIVMYMQSEPIRGYEIQMGMRIYSRKKLRRRFLTRQHMRRRE